MAVISTANHPAALWPGVHVFFGTSYNKHPIEHTQFFDMKASKMAYEEAVRSTGFGLAPIKSQGNATVFTSHSQADTTRYTHVATSLGAIVTKEEIDDNLYKSRAFDRAEMLAFSMMTAKETIAANVLNRAFNASFTGGDGKEMIATDHPSNVGSQSNELTTPADFSEASLEDLLIQIMTATNYEGLQISVKGNKLVIPPQLEFEAKRVLGSTLQSGTSNNDINAVRAMGVLPGGAVTCQYLTDPDAWFIKTNVPHGLTGFDRTPLTFTRDNDYDTDNAKMKAYARYSFGWSDWLGVFGSPGA